VESKRIRSFRSNQKTHCTAALRGSSKQHSVNIANWILIDSIIIKNQLSLFRSTFILWQSFWFSKNQPFSRHVEETTPPYKKRHFDHNSPHQPGHLHSPYRRPSENSKYFNRKCKICISSDLSRRLQLY
jgi:hypothetical protein